MAAKNRLTVQRVGAITPLTCRALGPAALDPTGRPGVRQAVYNASTANRQRRPGAAGAFPSLDLALVLPTLNPSAGGFGVSVL